MPEIAGLRLIPLLVSREVVEPFDELESRGDCLLGREGCNEASPCAAHHRWKEVSEGVAAFFRDTTVQELIHADALNGVRGNERSARKSR